MEILSVLYLIVFAFSGVLIAELVFAKDKPLKRAFFGLVFGLAMLLWLPVIYAFIMDFTVTAQLLALFTAAAAGIVCILIKNRKVKSGKLKVNREKYENLKPFLLTVIPLALIGIILHCNHTITSASNGSLHVGQCTYGDLCMHLGFISSITVQKTFPPDYSLMPGTALGYPFLCDSISSTFYTLGSSLRFATLLPALYAYIIVVLGVWFFFESVFKKGSVTALASYLFFIGGGLGFAYIFNNKQLLAAEGINRFSEMMTGFYKTPTNLPDEGLRWVNTIADMLVPQRATLFGWALLFPCLQLLYRAVMEKETSLFIPLGILAGCLPLVHTQSLAALGMISAFLFVWQVGSILKNNAQSGTEKFNVSVLGVFFVLLVIIMLRILIGEKGEPEAGRMLLIIFGSLSAIGLTALLISDAVKAKKQKQKLSVSHIIIALCAAAAAAVITFIAQRQIKSMAGLLICALVFAASAVYALIGQIKAKADKQCWKPVLMFLLFGLITVALAAPQLFGFTFKQSVGDGFLRWNFNWDNRSDGYLWFYIKNLGLIFILMLPAFIASHKNTRIFYSGSLLIWVICEFILFQPNPYDDNKLLFIWFAFTCGIVAEFLVNIYRKLMMPMQNEENARAKRAAVRVVSVFVLAALFLSGTLTLAREYVSADHVGIYTKENGKKTFGYTESGYEVVSAPLVKLTEFINENTEPDATFLTHNNHNNAVAMLTGRNIFCGSGTFLHWHGINYQQREKLIKEMYLCPQNCLMDYAAQYDIDYVLVSQNENHNYSVDSAWLESNLECIYDNDGIKLFRIGKTGSEAK